jgi:hypothetical protein
MRAACCQYKPLSGTAAKLELDIMFESQLHYGATNNNTCMKTNQEQPVQAAVGYAAHCDGSPATLWMAHEHPPTQAYTPELKSSY